MSIKLWFYPFLLLSLLWLNGCGETAATPAPEPTATAVSSSSSPDTDLIDLQLWQNGRLNPQFAVSGEQSGACWVGSLVIDRPDAWRCAYEDDDGGEPIARILDPCFANAQNEDAELACLNADFSVTRLRLQEPLPEQFANVTGLDELPLKVVLADGDQCGLLLGTTITVPLNGDMVRVNYACDSGGVLIGLPQKQADAWFMTYDANPGGEPELESRQVVQALVFNGRTATTGGAPLGTGTARITNITSTVLPDRHQLIFQFNGEDLPAFEIGYVNEPYTDLPPGANVMRVWFSYPDAADAEYNGERTVSGDYPAHVNGVQLVVEDGRDLIWALGLDEMVGFDVERSGSQLLLTLYEPVPHATNRPELGVGSQGTAVHALQSKLADLGYLNPIPPGEKYDEPTRQAVVAFQEANGILPNGVVGADTWAALERDTPPAATDGSGNGRVTAKTASAPVRQEAPQVTPNSSSGANLRQGPGLNYAVAGTLAAGQTVAVVGIVEGSSLETTWLQVCCVNGAAGWVRADVVRLEGSTSGVQGPSNTLPTPGAPLTTESVLPSERPSQDAAGNPILYFTFDDGPSAYTGQMTAALAQVGGHGTFFALGQNVTALPETAKAAYDAGHAVENHTYNHPSLDQLSPTEFFNEVDSTQTAIQTATGHTPICLRPPYGATNQQTYQQAAEMGLEIVLWDIDTQDWRRPGVDAIANHILESAFPGAVILMHDGGGDRSMSVQALQQTLPQLQQQGYVFAFLCR